MVTSKLYIDPKEIEYDDDDEEENRQALSFARMETHYFINGAFLESDNWILENISKI